LFPPGNNLPAFGKNASPPKDFSRSSSRMSTASTPFPTEGIKRSQIFSRPGAGFLYEKRSSLPATVNANVDTLWNNRKKGSINCEQDIIYKLSKSLPGQLGYGRIYGSKGSLERMEKECRGVLCQNFYYDIDIVNCHPVMLVQFAKNKYQKDLVELEKYCDNRDDYLSRICECRDDAKTAIIKILYGGKNEHPFLEPMAQEIKTFTKFLINRDEYKDLADACRSYKELKEWEKSAVTGIYGAFLSFVLQTEERKCMFAMADSFEEDGWKVDVYCYDGVMVRKSDLPLEKSLRKAEEVILTKVGYKLSVISKPFMTFKEFVDELTNKDLYKGVEKSKYLEMKREFEATNFYYAPTNEYYEYIKGKEPIVMTQGHATNYYSAKWIFRMSEKLDDYKEFFPMWNADPTRRIIKTMSMSPSNDVETFSIPIQLQYQKYEEPINADPPLEFLELLDITCANNNILKQYTLDWLSHLLQKPFDLPGTSLIFTGEKGVGKDTLWDFFMTYVVGTMYSHNYTDTKTFFEKHDCNIMNKFLVKLEEADSKICLENASVLKSRITGNYNTFNPKNSKTIKAENFCRVVMTTNGSCPVDMSSGERRFVVIPCSIEKKGDIAYWSTLRTDIFNNQYGRRVASFLLDRDISPFVVQKLPENEYQAAVIDSRKTSEEKFMEVWDGAECLASELYDTYKSYCIDNKLDFIRSPISFSKSMLKFMRSVLVIRRTSKGMKYSKKGAAISDD